MTRKEKIELFVISVNISIIMKDNHIILLYYKHIIKIFL